MARAQTTDHWQETRGSEDDKNWTALRSDLVALLNQVESQVAHTHDNFGASRTHTPSPAPNPSQPFDGGPHRRREALQSVNRALERFSDSDHESVAYAVDQIRGQRDGASHHSSPQSYGAPQPSHQGGHQAQLNTFNAAVDTLTDRLSRIEGDLRHRGSSAAPANLSEVANQIAQLTHVVELLAGAVGETGQVKRLEAQLGNIARMIEQAPRGEQGIGNRIDRLAATVASMLDQQQHAQDRPLSAIEDLASSQQSSFSAIESGVRSIYDRIDAIEQTFTADPSGMGQLGSQMSTISEEMAALTQAMKAGGSTSSSILSRIDALNARVNDVEAMGGSNAADGLRADITSLRQSVEESIEIRFASLEGQIGQIDRKIANSTAPRADISVEQLESQIRTLVERMDQTGQQLDGISKLYQNNPSSSDAPDFAALADMVAKRTTDAINKSAPKDIAIGNDSLAALEARMQQVLSGLSNDVAPSHFAEVQDSIGKVDARLGRLETLLNKSSAGAPHTQQNSVAERPLTPVHSALRAEPTPTPVKIPEPIAEPAAPAPKVAVHRAPSDTMRMNPSEDEPLFDQGLPPAPRQATAAVSEPAKVHPARLQPSFDAPTPSTQDQHRGDTVTDSHKQSFDPNTVERPAQPKSTLYDEPETGFAAEQRAAPARQQPSADHSATSASRNTFIEAARRAARTPEPAAASGAQSLIAKAFARFQSGEADAAPSVAPVAPQPQDTKPSRSERAEAAKAARAEKAEAKKAAKAAKAEGVSDTHSGMHQAPDVMVEADADHNVKPKSFIATHSRMLLLGTAVLVASLLVVNLIQRRMADDTAQAVTPSAPAITAPAEAPAPGINNQLLLDPEPTGSVDPFVRMVLPPLPGTTQDLPVALSDAARSAAGLNDEVATGSIPASTSLLSEPVQNPAPAVLAKAPTMAAIKVELPPDQIGPLALREAAANGDPRAQFEVAAIYTEGQALAQDFKAAGVWYERAAAQGFAPAEYRLGNLYEHGQGVEKDLQQAKLWYLRAAEAGNRMSMHNLAALYANGSLGKQEFSQAAEWFERAATRGLTDSQFNLGMLYVRGLGVQQNMGQSYKWFSLAARQGDKDAAKARDDVARSLDPETMTKLNAEIDSWQRTRMDIPANFAPIGTWAKDFNPGQTIADRTIVEKVQAALGRLGYDVGIPDGLMGPRTRDAIVEFETATGMSASGAINPRLLAVLGSQPV